MGATYLNKILLGNCLEVLKGLPDESIDAVVTDPPYGLGNKEPTVKQLVAFLKGADLKTGDFMGMPWDIPPVPVWREVYRVLKPGGHVLSFGGCYDEHTEVLTRKGWVQFPDAIGDEEFASLDLATHQVEWQRPKEVVRQPHHGPMFYYRTNKVDLVVTPNHNMLVATMGRGRNGTPNSFRLQRADEHGRAVRMTKTSHGRVDSIDPGVFRLPAVRQLTSHGHEREIPEKVIPLDAWLPFYGLWLAEGSATVTKNKLHRGHEHGRGYTVSITHFDLDNLLEIQRILADWFEVKVYSKHGRLCIRSKQLVSYLRQFGKAWQKFLPDWVKNLPSHRLRILWDWYMRGDGCAHRVGYTSSPRLRDDWQEVAMYMGLSADWTTAKPDKVSQINGRPIHPRRPQYVLRFNHAQSQPEVYDRKGKRKPVRTVIPAESWGGQMVYCVELPEHHTLYVRRNGKAVWCGNTRTWDLISLGLRAAGFESRDTIADEFPALQWNYASGMPKSLSVSKAIDRQLGAEPIRTGKPKPGHEKLFGTDFTGHAKGWDRPRMHDPEASTRYHEATAPATPQAKEWEGYGTGLCPSWEPIVVFRKPLSGTVASNVLEHGTGALNIDATRIKHASKADFEKHKAQVEAVREKGGVRGNSWKNASDLSGANEVREAGRWPKNMVFVHAEGCRRVGSAKVPAPVINRFDDGAKPFGHGAGHPYTSIQTGDENGEEEVGVWECIDGCPVKALDEQSGTTTSGAMKHEVPAYPGKSNTLFLRGHSGSSNQHGDSGTASRFFSQFEGAPFKYTTKASKRETSLDGLIENDHPTKKPVELMRWLVRLVCPKRGVVLDPYCGSGSTLHAASEEDMKYVGIERDPHAHEIATLRMDIVERREEERRHMRAAFDAVMELEDD